MRISTNWINDYVDIKDQDLKELALKITKAGVNVESVDSNHIDRLVTGLVTSCTPHPDSDHMKVCHVNVGSEEYQIVCGADNVRAGIKVIVALPGCILPGDNEIKKTMLRGVESNGMICALFELGLASKEKTYDLGILELDKDAPIGVDAMQYLGIDDTVYTLDLNPNRNDCLSHIGFAYEVASVLGRKVTMPDISTTPSKENVKDMVDVTLETENCSIYHAKMVKNVTVGESPEFIKQRLTSAGMRSINNVVDISNYIMLEYGQPLHFFDADKLGNHIVVRMAIPKEEIITLDKKTRQLRDSDIVITDGKNPVCIAGVMGGENTEVDENTKNIIIEGAIFHPYHIRYTSIHLDLRSEASLRYEKKMNPEYAYLAVERACHLLEKYAGGQPLAGTVIAGKEEAPNRQVVVNLERINQLLGMTLSLDDAKKSLDHLGFAYTTDNTTFTVNIPTRRMDVEENPADIIEEIGRLYGFDNIPNDLPIGKTKPGRYIGNVALRKKISKRLRALGFHETRTYTLISEEEARLFSEGKGNDITLLKPLSTDKNTLRQSLLPSLLKVAEYNKARGIKDVMIYEIANTYHGEQEEITKISLLMKGDYIQNNWNHVTVKTDFYLIKGMVENILDYLGFKNRYGFETKEIDSMHPGMTACILLDREPIGFIGRVHPSLCKEEVYVAEINMNVLATKTVKPIKHKELSKYPHVHKDLSFVMKQDISSKEVEAVIKKAGGRLLNDITVFDVYVGENVVTDEKSIAYSLTFSDPNKTLTDEEINAILERIIKEVEGKTKSKLRS